MTEYIEVVKNIKSEILRSRYLIAKVANRELLYLYFKVGKVVSEKVANENWGSGTVKKLSEDLQNELKGLRGFSSANIKKMRIFYEAWKPYLQSTLLQNSKSSLPTSQLKNDSEISPLSTDQLHSEKGSLLTNQFINSFLSVNFTAHYEILAKVKQLDERIFYITKNAEEFWTVVTLKHKLKNSLFEKEKNLPTNFNNTLSAEQSAKALSAFRDQYLLDFIALSDEEAENERLLESEIVRNIKKFLMSLGADFTFISNQYRLIDEDNEYFIDLLFFNRKLQSLVAFELKTGVFKPEYLGEMNFYLSALDEYVKEDHENPSIGIILCKGKKDKIVEFAFRGFNKAMGVATYETTEKLPEEYKDILPDAEKLKELMGGFDE